MMEVVVRNTIQKGADIDARDENEETVLHYAAVAGNERAVDSHCARGQYGREG